MKADQIKAQIQNGFSFLESGVTTQTEGIETLTDLHTALGNLDHAIEELPNLKEKTDENGNN